MMERLNNNEYSNEYDFQVDLYQLIFSAYDGHFYYLPDITQIFSFRRSSGLVSVSTDGISLPRVYDTADLAALLHLNGTNAKASPITQINGQGVEAVLNDLATLGGESQDPDANYNGVLLTVPLSSLLSKGFGLFYSNTLYQGTETILTFEDGTTRNVSTFAVTGANFSGVTDGPSFFKKFCTPQDTTGSSPLPDQPAANVTPPALSTQVPFYPVASQTALPAAHNYPAPYAIADDHSVSGYFPPEQPDLAVLAIPTFEPETSTVQFQDVVRQFLATAGFKNKTRLAIDLRGNAGGDIVLGYDLFKQLFPQKIPYGATNFRATPLFNLLGEAITSHYANVSSAEAATRPAYANNAYSSAFNVQSELDVMLQTFDSWSEFYGPHPIRGDNFTSLARYNFSDIFALYPDIVSGYQNLTNIVPRQSFAPENVILIQDGGCASTCAIFSELMKTQAGVRQIAFGGRAQIGPMQGVGSVKGASILPWTNIQCDVQEVFTYGTAGQVATINATLGLGAVEGAQRAVSRAAVSGGKVQANLNARNNIRLGDDTETPLQFVYEAADCRLFYTAEMIHRQSKVWFAAYDAMFRNGSCVPGSTGNPSSLPGTGYINASPPAGADNMFGANDTSVWPTDLPRVGTSDSTNATGTTPTSGAPSGSYSVPPAMQSNNAAVGLSRAKGLMTIAFILLAGLMAL